MNNNSNIRKEDDMKKKNEPVQTIRFGRIEVAIWENEGKQDRAFYSTTLTRSYKDEDGNWQQTSSLSGSELLVASKALETAYLAIQELKAAETA